jgi:hypothetical protein
MKATILGVTRDSVRPPFFSVAEVVNELLIYWHRNLFSFNGKP